MKFESLEQDYKRLLEAVKIKKSWSNGFSRVATQIRHHKERYQRISEDAGGSIPWEFIGVIHNLECGLSFAKHLHNGDSLRRRTYRVPAGRPRTHNGPFTFEESARDALRMKGYHKITDWSMERMCYELERYNGFGYRKYHPSVLSPYLWSGTNLYSRGKYVSDGRFSSAAVSKQAGTVGLLMALNVDRKTLPKLSRKSNLLDRAKKAIYGIFGGGILSWNTLHEARQFMTDNAGVLLLLFAGLAFFTIKFLETKTQEDVNNGHYMPSGLIEDDNNV